MKQTKDEYLLASFHLTTADIIKYNTTGIDLSDLDKKDEPTIDAAELLELSDRLIIKEESSEESDNMELKKLIKQKDERIEALEKQISSMVNDKNGSFGNPMDIAIKMNINFIDNHSNEQTTLQKVTLLCSWCTYEFNDYPCPLVENIIGSKYYISGCYCSFNCAIAENNAERNDYNCSNRESLTKRLYNLICKNEDDIYPAPHRKTQRRYGGFLTDKQYHELLNARNREYRIVMPPMIPMVPVIEETMIDRSSIHNSSNKLVLKRSKPLPNSNADMMVKFGIIKK